MPTRETTEEKPEVTQEDLDKFIKDYKIQINKKLNLEENSNFSNCFTNIKKFLREIYLKCKLIQNIS